MGRRVMKWHRRMCAFAAVDVDENSGIDGNYQNLLKRVIGVVLTPPSC